MRRLDGVPGGVVVRWLAPVAPVALLALALVACGAPDSRTRCSLDSECGTGQYCAAAGVCWPHQGPPVIDSFTATCPAQAPTPAPCLRDSTVAVSVVAHDDVNLASVTASLDLAPGTVVPLTLQGGAWKGSLKLGDWPFPSFERAVAVTVQARDAAGNTTASTSSLGVVTRLRWVVEFAPGELPVPVPGAVAVDGQGTAIFGATNGKVHFIGPDGVAARAPVPVGTGALTAPVVVGSDGVWVPSDDGKVYRVTLPAVVTDPVVVQTVCDTGAAVKGIAILTTGETIASSNTGGFFAAKGTTCRNSPIYSGSVSHPPIAKGSDFYGAEGINLRSYYINATGFPVEPWSAPASLGSLVAAPLALNPSGVLFALTTPAAGGNSLFAVSPAGVPAPLAATGVPADGPVIRANDDMVVPEKAKALSCWTSTGNSRWQSAALPGIPLTPMVLTGDDALVVADDHGNLSILDATGLLRWSVQLAPAAIPLRPPNLYAPPGTNLSTGYFPAANGKLHAVILDGRLDAAAPWPKAFHDPRNTGNSSTALPP